jgi:thioredoxin reductase
MEVGYVGLGAMGGALAKRLLKSRWLRLYDLRPEAAQALTADGGAVRALEFADGDDVACDRIFFSIGHRPADDLAVQLGCRRDDDGMIEVDHAFHTSERNVFAAGDIVPGPHLGIAAAAHGAIAAAAIHRSLIPEGRKL